MNKKDGTIERGEWRFTPVDHDAPSDVIPISKTTLVVLGVASIAGLMMFLWPLFFNPTRTSAHLDDAPFLFVVLLPLLIGVVVVEMTRGGLDTKAVAVLGVLTAVGAILRPLSAGTAGIELVFFLLILAGRVMGPGFGFALGLSTLFTSALLTGGVGPWLPFQMFAAAWVGAGAGLIPLRRRLRGFGEIVVLCVYGIFAAYAFGFIMNMWFWPFAIGNETALSFVPGASLVENLKRFFWYTLATSTLGWDTGRAITNTIAIAALGPAVLTSLRRAARRCSAVKITQESVNRSAPALPEPPLPTAM